METGLEGKPWYQGLAIGLVVGAVAFAFGYNVKIKEMRKSIDAQQVRIASLDDEIRRGEAAKAQLPQFEERIGRMEEELGKLLAILPNRRKVHELLGQFRQLAEQEDFVLTKFTPAAEVEQEFYYEWSIAMSLEGTYHNLARFFERMSRFTRIINVDALKINATRTPTLVHSIDASFIAKTFVYKDASTAEPGAQPRPGGS